MPNSGRAARSSATRRDTRRVELAAGTSRVDDAVVAAGEVVIGSGLRRSKFLLAGADLLALPGAEQLTLAQPMA